jgi:uncharacterized iron-regulated protein
MRGCAVLAASQMFGCALHRGTADADNRAGPVPGSRGPSGSGRLFIDAPGAPLPDALNGLFDPVAPIEYLLLGEVHDHPLQHRLRADWLQALASRGRFALAMEQFDATRQGDIDRARASRSGAREIAQAAAFQFKGWDWAFYEPYVELALRHDLPLVAANLSMSQARSIARGAASPMQSVEPADWSDVDRERIAEEIRLSHCGMLPASAIAPMVAAQQARDATIAHALVDAHREWRLPVVLLAGSGHVRRDLGVPRYLRDIAPGARIFSVGLVERNGADDDGSDGRSRDFDLTIETPAHPRTDPCAVFRNRPAAAPKD